MSLNSPEITVIGGGTGSFTLLKELKEFTPNISAVVNMSDDGGSSGTLRDELDVLPPGDIRQCLVALSDLPEARELFSYRFGKGMLAGQSVGNLVLSALELQYEGDYERAIDIASSLLQVRGRVIPVTLQKHDLIMMDGESVVRGEHIIGHRHFEDSKPIVFHDPPSPINPAAEEAIVEADLVVVAPGNLYGSLLPALAVEGMKDAFIRSDAQKVVVSNLVNKTGQTDGWHVADYIKTIEEYIGTGQIDTVLFNDRLPSNELLQRYAKEGEYPLDISAERFQDIGARAIGACLISDDIYSQHSNDTLMRRTLIRHDAHQVGRQLMRLFYSD